MNERLLAAVGGKLQTSFRHLAELRRWRRMSIQLGMRCKLLTSLAAICYEYSRLLTDAAAMDRQQGNHFALSGAWYLIATGCQTSSRNHVLDGTDPRNLFC